MDRYAVLGASHGVGLAVVEELAREGACVRAVSRHPPPARAGVEPVAADVTDPRALLAALDDDFQAVFFTVESSGGLNGRGLFGSRSAIRATTYQGCVNVLEAIRQTGRTPMFVLLSATGVDRPSLLWRVADMMKPGMRVNLHDRERAVIASRLPYVILRAPILSDAPAGTASVRVCETGRPFSARMKVSRGDVASALIEAAHSAPLRSCWDITTDTAAEAARWWPTRAPVMEAA